VDDGSDRYWFHGDQLGSIVGITNSSGVEIVGYEYTPFGSVVVSGSASIKDQPLGYTGAWTDRATGLINLGHRWYDPATGAWTQPDPAGPIDSYNLFAYVGGDPVNHLDENGLWPGKKLFKKGKKAAKKAGRKLKGAGRKIKGAANGRNLARLAGATIVSSMVVGACVVSGPICVGAVVGGYVANQTVTYAVSRRQGSHSWGGWARSLIPRPSMWWS